MSIDQIVLANRSEACIQHTNYKGTRMHRICNRTKATSNTQPKAWYASASMARSREELQRPSGWVASGVVLGILGTDVISSARVGSLGTSSGMVERWFFNCPLCCCCLCCDLVGGGRKHQALVCRANC